jgi:hypothetical protein
LATERAAATDAERAAATVWPDMALVALSLVEDGEELDVAAGSVVMAMNSGGAGRRRPRIGNQRMIPCKRGRDWNKHSTHNHGGLQFHYIYIWCKGYKGK